MGSRGRRKKPQRNWRRLPKDGDVCELSLGGYLVFESWLGIGNRSYCILGRKRLNTGYWVFTKSLEGVKEQA